MRKMKPPAEDRTAAGGPDATKQRWQALQSSALLYLAVGTGAIVGGMARWFIGDLLHAAFPDGLPWGTIFVNVTGSFVIGFYAALTGPDGRMFAGSAQRQFVMTGICGGYTTFSTFSLESARLLESGQMLMAGLNVAISLAGSLIAVWGGFALATWLSRLGR